MNKLQFIGTDGVVYEFPLSVTGENIPQAQLERWNLIFKAFDKYNSTKDDQEQFNGYFELSDTLFNFIAYDFFNEYPNHEISQFYSKLTGLTSKGIVAFASLVGSVNEYVSLIQKLSEVTNESKSAIEKRAKKSTKRTVDGENQVRLINTSSEESTEGHRESGGTGDNSDSIS
jgi:hypothetical protein